MSAESVSEVWIGPAEALYSAEPETPRGCMRAENVRALELYLAGRVVAPATEESYASALGSWDAAGCGPIGEAGGGDVEAWLARAHAGDLRPSTVRIYATKLRALLEWSLLRAGASKRAAKLEAAEAFDPVPWRDLTRRSRLTELDLDMLIRPGELGALVRTAVHPRPRAFIAVGLESGCRKGELIGARVRDLEEGRDYSELRVTGKTGLRVLPLVRSLPTLEAWLDASPDTGDSQPLFPTVLHGRPRRMGEHAPNELMNGLCARAGLRHLHPHQLRHTRLTELAAAGLGEYQLNSFAGWRPGSKMAARYIHLSGMAHMGAVLRIEGLDVRRPAGAGAEASAEVPGMLARILQEVPREVAEIG